jgi:uncharacterized caspase-like protein
MKTMKKLFVLFVLLQFWAGFVQAQKPCGEGTIYAVIVGVADYQMQDISLKYSDDDARSFRDVILRHTPASNIILLVNEEATCANILQSAQTLFSRAGENDRLIFFFSGHGDDGVFVPYDVQQTGENLLYHSDIKKIFKASRAQSKFIFADACMAGSMRAPANPNASSSSASSSDVSVVVFLSSRNAQYSQESERLKESVFSFYLIKGLRGAADSNKDRNVTVKEIYTYTHKLVSESTSNDQVPVMWGHFDDNLPVLCW